MTDRTDFFDLAQELAPRGRLVAALSLGNPVLASSRTSTDLPAGVTVDLSRALAAELGIDVEFLEFKTPGESVEAVSSGRADVGFVAIDPACAAAGMHYTPPYIQIEGCHAVRLDSSLQSRNEVDRAGIHVIVGQKSAYDLPLSRHLQHAAIERIAVSGEVLQTLLDHAEWQVGAGVKQQLASDIARLGGARLLDGAFMAIEQAMTLPSDRSDRARAAVERFIAEKSASGFIGEALRRHGIEGATVLPVRVAQR